MNTQDAFTDQEHPEHPLFCGRLLWRVFLKLQQGDRLAAIKAVRTWLVVTKRGDSFTRAKKLVEDVDRLEPWVRVDMDATRPARNITFK
jgi:ribosomal protein L7/L12